jgi:hypothetical protein
MRFLLFLLLLLTGASSPAQTPSLKSIPGTRCALIPEPGFVLSRKFNGFVNEEKNAMLIVSVTAQPCDTSFIRLFRQYERTNEMNGLNTDTVMRSTGISYFFEGTHTLRDTLRQRYVLLFGGQERTVMVTASVPAKDQQTCATVRKMMLTTVYDSTMKEDASELLDFSLDLNGTCFKEVRYSKGGMLYSCDGLFPTSHADGVNLLAGISVRPKRIEDRKAYTLSRLGSMPGVDSLISNKIDTIVIDKIPGYEVSAIARSKTGKEMHVYMVLLFETDLQYFIIGGSCTGNYEQRMAEMRKAAASFKRKTKR